MTENPLCWLRPLVPADAAAAFDGLSNPALYRFIPREPPPSVAALEADFERMCAGAPAESGEIWLNWMVHTGPEDRLVGTVQGSIDADGSAAVAYFVFLDAQRQGIATAAVRIAIEEMRIVHGVRRFVAEIDTRNRASCALVERLGFRLIATTRDADHFKGSTSDEYLYALDVSGS